MPLVDYDYEYEYDYEPNKRRRSYNHVTTVSSSHKKKMIYDYNFNNVSSFDSVHEYNIPSGIKEKRSNKNYSESDKISKKSKKENMAEMNNEETSKNQKSNNKNRIFKHFNNFCLSVIGIAIVFCILYRSSMINEKFNQVEKAKKELLTSQTVNEQLQAEIDSETDLSYIENFAKYQLGMQKPQDSQIVYVNIKKQDRVLTPVVIEEDIEESWVRRIAQQIDNIF